MKEMKPVIVVLSNPDDDTFNWCSEGWYQMKQRGEKQAERLMNKARNAISAGKDVQDVIKRLEKAGFEVVRVDRIIAQEYGG